MRNAQHRAVARWSLLLLGAALLAGCQGQPMFANISLGGFGFGAPYGGDGGFVAPYAIMPGVGWGGGWGVGGEGEHGWGGGWGEDH